MSKENFKVGDTVECIENKEDITELTIGKKYEVVGSTVFNDGKIPSVLIVDDLGLETFYCSRDFKLAKQEEEPNYMYVWDDDDEKGAFKREVISDLHNNPRQNNINPVIVLNCAGVVTLYEHCKSIEQWEADNKPKAKYRPFTMEEFDKVGIKLINKELKRRETITSYDDKTVIMRGSINDISLTYADLLKIYTLIDGTPCGVKE